MRAALYAHILFALLCSLLALATSASAASGWVMWNHAIRELNGIPVPNGDVWQLEIVTYPTEVACESQKPVFAAASLGFIYGKFGDRGAITQEGTTVHVLDG
jgi:hypothetical protein